MVWFQCEDCGENLKKPKLPNHFRMCSATKLSCIDCGVMFGRESVQSHTQCITEAEKYGPKGATPKQNKEAKKGPDFDLNVGLSQRPPWFCSLCNTKASSQQTLLLHAEGKKHRGKARAIHAAKQPPKQTEESDQKAAVPVESEGKCELAKTAAKEQDTPKAVDAHTGSENGKLSSKKRKHGASGKEASNGYTSVERIETKEKDGLLKKAKADVPQDHTATEPGSMKEDSKRNIKWKTLIQSALKANAGTLKMRKLKKVVLKSLQESGISEDETQLSNTLEHKINSSSKFKVEGKYVLLVAIDEVGHSL